MNATLDHVGIAVKDLAVAVYRERAPFRGLPPDLYKTEQGGWSNINLTYKLP